MVLSKKVGQLAQKRANQRMRVEILPRLSLVHPRPNSWNPLRADFNGRGYAMKLRMPDPLVMEIMRNPAILDDVAEIVISAVRDSALEESKAFVTTIFESLMSS